MNAAPVLAMRVEREFAAFDTLVPAIDDFLGSQLIPTRTCHLVHLAVEEMLLNLIKYSPSSSNQVDVMLQRLPHKLVVALEDDGKPFDPRALPKKTFDQPLENREPGGMGIHLVLSMLDDVRYFRVGGRNRLEMDIPIAASDSSSSSTPRGPHFGQVCAPIAVR